MAKTKAGRRRATALALAVFITLSFVKTISAKGSEYHNYSHTTPVQKQVKEPGDTFATANGTYPDPPLAIAVKVPAGAQVSPALTGDDTPTYLYIILFAVSAVALVAGVVVIVVRKRKK